jgi:signal transduction histidine kinase
MDRLIGDLRELAQVEGGGLSIQRGAVDLVGLAQEAVERVRTLTTGHAVRLEAPDLPIVVAGDRDRLGQVLDNLLGNAVKYSPKGSEVLVTVEVAKGEARLRVADQGPGIPVEALPHLFERFYRGQPAAGDSGLGLGLYISRMLVEAHGGRIWAASTSGVGSTFTVVLPLVDRS